MVLREKLGCLEIIFLAYTAQKNGVFYYRFLQ